VARPITRVKPVGVGLVGRKAGSQRRRVHPACLYLSSTTRRWTEPNLISCIGATSTHCYSLFPPIVAAAKPRRSPPAARRSRKGRTAPHKQKSYRTSGNKVT
jgi:hypothetical protein